MAYSCLTKTVSVEMGKYRIRYISIIYVEMTNASTEILPTREEKNISVNHQAQNKIVLLYHKAFKMLQFLSFLPQRPCLIHC